MNVAVGYESRRKRILALHGRGGNSTVTKAQLQNLGLSETEFNILYADGLITDDRSGIGLEAMGGLVQGPWHSWLPDISNDDSLTFDAALQDAVCDAVRSVLLLIERYGPFDGIFGFSQGAVIATLVNNLAYEKNLKSALEKRYGKVGDFLTSDDFLFDSIIIACAGLAIPYSQFRQRAGLGPMSIATPASNIVHLIGREDQFKTWSESFALAFDSFNSSIFYMKSGHEINLLVRDNTELCESVKQCFETTRHKTTAGSSISQGLTWSKTSGRSSRAVASGVQIAAVKVETDGLPETIIDMLAAQPPQEPLFRLARERDPSVHTTYGQMLAFCKPGGDGDLRRLGVRSEDVVAYLAPPGGSATAAGAFLAIASQTCAVPISRNMNETDTRLALEQYGVKHIILFDGISAPAVAAAAMAFAKSGRAYLHHATAAGQPPGLFRYSESLSGYETSPILHHPPVATCLLLRTSGTTSVPKVVPIRQRDIVINAAILADGIGIDADDVTYSVMPLDHIGGLSASLLCSVAVGATVTCDEMFSPQGMVEALLHSSPKPTWYSAVPTIHNAALRYIQSNAEKYLDKNGKWHGHKLRFIRSGAAALREPDRILLEEVFGCEVVTTYSMSEQMPICQPPSDGAGKHQKPGSVGVPVIASLAVVDPITLLPLPFGITGEVAISGATVFSGYLDNPFANRQASFLLQSHEDERLHTWMLTGDLGDMDPDGTLSLRGRLKELIKRGGEQVSPFEVEAVLTHHPCVETAVCFPVPSEVYGEEIGCAIVLSSSATANTRHTDIIKDVREFLRRNGLASFKFPSHWKIVEDRQLPKTASQKYIRNGLASALGLTAQAEIQSTTGTVSVEATESKTALASRSTPQLDWSTLAGFRFLLACYVMFMHIGSDYSWGAFANLRQFPWHVHAFFVVAGFSMAVVMPSPINRKASFVWARVWAMYPLYAVALLLAIFNLLPSCNPGTFSSAFHWNSQLSDIDHLFCEGTPIFQNSWFVNLLSTVVVYSLGLSATPLWTASWFLGFYVWFISMYFQCLVVFPYIYNRLYKERGNTLKLGIAALTMVVVNVVILLSFWYGYAVYATGYASFDPSTGMKQISTVPQIQSAAQDNAVMLGFYLFAPFWIVYFIAGMCVAFLYDAIRPAEQHRAYIWGYVADALTVAIFMYSVAHVAQGYIPHIGKVADGPVKTFFLRPAAADSYMDPGIVNRIWDEVNSRLWAPIILFWIFSLGTGRGITARVLRLSPISQTLAPTAYACFLFHQMVGQWYYAATRDGLWWNWWSYRKEFYWFSPKPLPVEWYEYFYVVGLIVIFCKALNPLDSYIRRIIGLVPNIVRGVPLRAELEKDTLTVVVELVNRATGFEVKADWSLEECGLASLGVVQLVSALEAKFSTPKERLLLSVSDIVAADSIRQIAIIVNSARSSLRHLQSSALQTA